MKNVQSENGALCINGTEGVFIQESKFHNNNAHSFGEAIYRPLQKQPDLRFSEPMSHYTNHRGLWPDFWNLRILIWFWTVRKYPIFPYLMRKILLEFSE